MSGGFELEHPQRVTVGTVGPVGERLFVLQVRDGPTLLTMKMEKAQVSALARLLGRLLGDLSRPGELPEQDALILEAFDEPDFVVGAVGVSYDPDLDRVMLVIEDAERVSEELDPDDPFTGRDDEEEFGDRASARLALSREQAAALAVRGTELVESGRPPCPLCGYPLDPRGHVCPRTNGHRPPLT